jgi:hypothetical protein
VVEKFIYINIKKKMWLKNIQIIFLSCCQPLEAVEHYSKFGKKRKKRSITLISLKAKKQTRL